MIETRTIVIAAAAQFLVILGFSVVMPIGPDIALDLGFPIAHLGLLASSYALAGFGAALVSAGLLDRLGRRAPLVAALALLGLATVGASVANSLTLLMVMRAIAGGCGGICTALLTAIIADTVSTERRGRAYALVLGMGPLVSILGLPLAIHLAAISSWRTPLLLLGCAALAVTGVARFALPPLADHLAGAAVPTRSFLRDASHRPAFRAAMAGVFIMTVAYSLLTASNAALLLLNLHLPRAWLATFYMCCGGVTFLLLRGVGRVADRYGPFPLILPTVASLCGGIFFSYVLSLGPAIGAAAMFVTIMSVSTLSVSMMTLALRAPAPSERAGFGALLGALQNLAVAVGAGLSSSILTDLPGPRLGNAYVVGLLAISTASVIPLLGKRLQRHLGATVLPMSRLATQPSEQPVTLEESQCRNGPSRDQPKGAKGNPLSGCPSTVLSAIVTRNI